MAVFNLRAPEQFASTAEMIRVFRDAIQAQSQLLVERFHAGFSAAELIRDRKSVV